MTRVVVLALAVMAAAACKPKEVPFQPPPKDDAAVRPIDAQEIDAPVAEAPPQGTKIVVGDHASCVLLTDATVRCWGENASGQLGDGSGKDSATPVRLNLRGVKDIVLGAAHGCALLDDESVTCWGKINYGAKGSLLAPAAVPGVSKAKRLFAVAGASCATVVDGSLVCWGDIDVKGHVRLAGTSTRAPTPSAGLERVAALTANGALKDDGTVWYWGEDRVPVRTAMTDVVEIASYGDEVCGLRRDGSVACAGPATRCAAAAPEQTATPAKKPVRPVRKKAAPRKTKKAATKTFAAAKPAPKPDSALPIEVLRLPPAKHLAFDVGLCVVTRAGKLQCLAAGDACKVDAPWPGLASVDYVTGHCARLADGDARCWSADKKSRGVAEVAGVAGAMAIAASASHACALLGDRSVVCWGSNRSGALGRGHADEKTYREASPVTF